MSGKLEPNYLLAVSYAVDRCESNCLGLQVVQVFYGRGRNVPYPPQIKPHTITVNNVASGGFVDRGSMSPAVMVHGQEVGHATKPYFYGLSELLKNASGCHISIYDQPMAVIAYQEAYLETAVVCIDYRHKGWDRVLKVLRWGWQANPLNNLNRVFWSSPRDVMLPPNGQPVEATVPSPEFRKIVGHFYPQYRYRAR